MRGLPTFNTEVLKIFSATIFGRRLSSVEC
jgi:hypothetical protein